jgi:hypothetical protein
MIYTVHQVDLFDPCLGAGELAEDAGCDLDDNEYGEFINRPRSEGSIKSRDEKEYYSLLLTPLYRRGVNFRVKKHVERNNDFYSLLLKDVKRSKILLLVGSFCIQIRTFTPGVKE